MTDQARREDYRDVLEDLAHSRCLSGAQELAQAAATAAPQFAARAILEDPPGRSGRAIDAAISLTEQEKDRLARAWMHAFIRPS